MVASMAVSSIDTRARAGADGRVCTAAAIVALLVGLAPARAQAELFTGAPPLVLETGGGWQGPIGDAGLAIVYDPGQRLSAGIGLGFVTQERTSYPVGAFGRLRLLRHGDLALGLGFLLNDAKCRYQQGVISYEGDCESQAIPAAYHFAVQPGRVIPQVTASLGLRLGGHVEVDGAYRSPRAATLLAFGTTLASLAFGGVLWETDHDRLSLSVLATGLAFGPASGHLFAGAYSHAVATSLLRGSVLVLGTFVVAMSTIRSSDCQGSQCDASVPGVVSGGTLLASAFALAVYDLIDAPRSARRANAQHGLPSLALLPSVRAANGIPRQGLDLVGRF
jgi:hypothetical protein